MELNQNELRAELQEARLMISTLEAERSALIARILKLEASLEPLNARVEINNFSSPEKKIRLFRELFFGRQDVYAKRWESSKTGKSGYQPACANEWVEGLCGKKKEPRIPCEFCPQRALLPLTDEILDDHLRGKEVLGQPTVIGIYPLLTEDRCRLLALDFDGKNWEEDSLLFYQICLKNSVPATRERSRSGHGCHVWILFETEITARKARQLGTFLLDQTMKLRPELGLSSYDRMFPNQDQMPKGGFGNLIALPLQKASRELGNTLFIGEDGEAYPDPWLHLANLARLEENRIDDLLEQLPTENLETPIICPTKLQIQLSNRITIKDALPATLKNELIRLASFHNPEFYKRDRARLSTYNIPRWISCAELGKDYLTLPRGLLDEVQEVLIKAGIKPEICDQRFLGSPLAVSFLGKLNPEQKLAEADLLASDLGVLVAPPGFGKTVLALSVLAKRAVNTLILVNRNELKLQWLQRIKYFLALAPEELGEFSGRRKKPTNKVDVATFQSLYRRGEVQPLAANYGQLIIDECHHVPARSFERVVECFRGKYVLGLSATVVRKDGHHPIIFMQSGPARHRVDPRKQAKSRNFAHRVILRLTGFSWTKGQSGRAGWAEMIQALVEEQGRNELI